jgi:hypothetical protein
MGDEVDVLHVPIDVIITKQDNIFRRKIKICERRTIVPASRWEGLWCSRWSGREWRWKSGRLCRKAAFPSWATSREGRQSMEPGGTVGSPWRGTKFEPCTATNFMSEIVLSMQLIFHIFYYIGSSISKTPLANIFNSVSKQIKLLN